MDYTFAKDFGTIIGMAALAGGVGGFVWDVANPIRRSQRAVMTGLENRITWPKTFKLKNSNSGLDLGFLGPLIIGACTGIVVVLVAGRSGPDGAELLRVLADVNAAEGAAATQAAKDAEAALSTGIDRATLLPYAFIGGIAGWALLQTLATRLTSAFETAGSTAATAATAAVMKAAAADNGVSDESAARIALAVQDAAMESLAPVETE